MNLHEYQSKQLFAKQGIPVPEGKPAQTVDKAREAAQVLDGGRWVVKAQVHAGGRGKAGGVVLVDSLDAVEAEAERLLGSRLVTKQTGEPGLPIDTLLIEEPTDIDRELYLSALVDRAEKKILFMASSAGGMNIEEVAEETPEKIETIHVDPAAGLQGYQCRKLAFALELEGQQIREFNKFMQGLYNLFVGSDASLVEINPLVVTKGGNLIALDAKINLDDNAFYRQSDLVALRDVAQEDEREAKAKEHDLNYITLDGNIGCMVNGAGLAMATMDLVQLKGGSPANFLDVGGGTTAERVAEAFKLILSDDKVEAVLVNIFGGIVRCDLIADGIIQAVQEVDIKVPVVVRLEGTNAPAGLEKLAASGLAIETAADLSEGAEKVVAAAKR
ncbi:MAG: ADP-forming succinate--CoA ligase subunit beta [Candidatus Sedimenticola sp. 20ELBAFRAG]